MSIKIIQASHEGDDELEEIGGEEGEVLIIEVDEENGSARIVAS